MKVRDWKRTALLRIKTYLPSVVCHFQFFYFLMFFFLLHLLLFKCLYLLQFLKSGMNSLPVKKFSQNSEIDSFLFPVLYFFICLYIFSEPVSAI